VSESEEVECIGGSVVQSAVASIQRRRPTSICSRLATFPFFQVGLLSKLHFIEMLRATRKRLKYEALDTK
jgi:hypothetical protein